MVAILPASLLFVFSLYRLFFLLVFSLFRLSLILTVFQYSILLPLLSYFYASIFIIFRLPFLIVALAFKIYIYKTSHGLPKNNTITISHIIYEAYNIIVPFPLINCLLSYILLLHMYIIPLVLVIIFVLNTQFYIREIKFRKKKCFLFIFIFTISETLHFFM